MNIYQQQILDKYTNHHHRGKPADYSHSARVENLSCGDEIVVYLKVANDKLVSMKYVGNGCVISLAAAEIMAEELLGQSEIEIKDLEWEDAVGMLGIELTTSRIKCAHLALQAIQQAFDNPLLKTI